MRDLRDRLGSLHTSLDEGDVESATEHARAIAIACDDQEVHHVDPALFGPRFVEIDQELHSAAARMAEVLETGDLDAAQEGYGSLHRACVTCHEQAPSAGQVDLSSLAPESVLGEE